MTSNLLNQMVETALHEGHNLYPNPASSRENRERFSFGRVYPEAHHDAQHGADTCCAQVRCLVRHAPQKTAGIRVNLRFLQPMIREVSGLDMLVVPALDVDGHIYQTSRGAIERDVAVDIDSSRRTASARVCFPDSRQIEEIRNRRREIKGLIVRSTATLKGRLDVTLDPIDDEVSRLTVSVTNSSPLREDQLDDDGEVLMRTFASAHFILHVKDGAVLSTV